MLRVYKLVQSLPCYAANNCLVEKLTVLRKNAIKFMQPVAYAEICRRGGQTFEQLFLLHIWQMQIAQTDLEKCDFDQYCNYFAQMSKQIFTKPCRPNISKIWPKNSKTLPKSLKRPPEAEKSFPDKQITAKKKGLCAKGIKFFP